MNCPNCGAVIKEGKFCNYCGAKLPSDDKTIEVNINKRIEDVAEIKRAEYETDESKLHQRQMKAQFAARKIRRWSTLILLLFCAVFGGYGLIADPRGGALPALCALAIIFGVFLLFYIIYLLITGKW